jgi:hypothetical protein
MYPFFRIPRLQFDNGVIPKIKVMSVTNSTTTATLSLCPYLWRQLRKEGLFLLDAINAPSTASATLPVLAKIGNTTIPVSQGDGSNVIGSQITEGNKYLVYYNKDDGKMQFINYYAL